MAQNPTPPSMPEDAFSEALADWHQALTEGKPIVEGEDAHLRRVQQFLHHIDEFWSSTPGPSTDTLPHRMSSIGRLQLRHVIGIGGFAIVYLAHDPLLNRPVAVKLPRPEVLLAPGALERFAREARAIAQLNHPNIVPIFDCGELAAGHYLVTAYCGNGTLADWLKRQAAPVSFRLAASLVAQLADAVQHAHERQILHRDLKPSNVLLELPTVPLDTDLIVLGSHPRISDFGLSKMFEGAKASEKNGITTGSAMLGTPSYMAPEQVRGAGVGPAADIYALGVILYELLTGVTPFHADHPVETLKRVMDEEPQPVSQLRHDVPPDVEAVCLRCLEKDPARRHATAGALADDLRRYLRGEPTRTRPWSRTERMMRWLRARRWIGTMAAASVVLVTLAITGVVWHFQETGRISDELNQADQRVQEHSNQVARQSKLVSEHEFKSARLAYEAQIRSAAEFYRQGQFALAFESLHSAKVQVGDQDLRGFEWHWLKAANRSVVYLRGQQHQPMLALAFSRANEIMAVSEDKAIYTWDAQSGALLRCVPFNQWFERVEASDDGQRLAFWWRDADLTVHCQIRNPAGDVLVQQSFPIGLKTPGILCQLHPSGRQIALEGLHLQAVGAKAPVPLEQSGDAICAMTFSPDGGQLALARKTGNRGYFIDFHHTDSGVRIVRRNITFAPVELTIGKQDDKEFVAARDSDGRVAVWNFNLNPDKRSLLYELAPAPDLRVIRLSPSGKYLLLGSGSKRGKAPLIALHDSETGKLLDSLDESDITVSKVAFSRDEKQVAIGCADGVVRLWSPKSLDAQSVAELTIWSHWPLPSSCIAFAPGSSQWACGGEGGIVRVQVRGNDRKKQTLRPHDSMVGGIAYSPDGEWLATGGFDKKVVLRNLKFDKALPPCEGHTKQVRTVAFSADSKLLASAGSDEIIRIWDVPTGAAKAMLQGHIDVVRQVAFSPQKNLLASAGNDQVVRLWDVVENRCVAQLVHTGQVWSVAFSPDGRHLVTGGQDRIVRVWDTRTHALLHSMRGHREGIRSVVYAPDGRTIASGDTEGVLRLWSAETAQELIEFSKQPPAINQLAFSPDGRLLAAALQNGTIRCLAVFP